MHYRLQGLIAAAYTPMHDDGSLRLDQVGPMVDHLVEAGVSGIYICGSTGEGVSMSTAERRQVAEAFLRHAKGRLTCIVHVGHNSIAEARELAQHARGIGADITSAVCPSYFKPGSVSDLIDTMADIASATPDLPFYYYHIPHMTGVDLDMVDLLHQVGPSIPNFAGIKYTSNAIHTFEACRRVHDGRFDMVWGFDETLLYGLTAGARAAIGSTYSIAGPLYADLMRAFEQDDPERAHGHQQQAITLIRCLYGYPFHPAVKTILTWMGIPCGPCRLPLPAMTPAQQASLRKDLEAIGFVPEAMATMS